MKVDPEVHYTKQKKKRTRAGRENRKRKRAENIMWIAVAKHLDARDKEKTHLERTRLIEIRALCLKSRHRRRAKHFLKNGQAAQQEG